MVALNSSDAAILARVAKYSRFAPVRRRKMLQKASPEAQAIGNIVITRDYNAATPDYARAARDIVEWAAEENPQQVEIPAYSVR